MLKIYWHDGHCRPHYDELIKHEIASFTYLDRPADLMMHFIDIGCGLWIHLSGGAEENLIHAELTEEGPARSETTIALAA
ncbi:hypothetical protein [Aliiruegeria sabulilitoris]|uniref:hypothetical protein n=1 Tax=Aliiruegeria sabulilitoris TaxID=1510458 RepID=UPI0012E37E31|nr:hypothetical protein [Aliiruegeria sabulilitoris]NDR58641.1 hypothetical protein [Pseudoruegeria sp. M32A2M]